MTIINEVLGSAFHEALKIAKQAPVGTTGIGAQIASHGTTIANKHMKALKAERTDIAKEKGYKHALLHDNLIRSISAAIEADKDADKAMKPKVRESVEELDEASIKGLKPYVIHHPDPSSNKPAKLISGPFNSSSEALKHVKTLNIGSSSSPHKVLMMNDKGEHNAVNPDGSKLKVNNTSKNESIEELDEVLTAKHSSSEWVHDFVHSKNPKFAGKSKEERIAMAVAAHYAAQRNESIVLAAQTAAQVNESNLRMSKTRESLTGHEARGYDDAKAGKSLDSKMQDHPESKKYLSGYNKGHIERFSESTETTYRVTNSHHNIATSVKASSPKEARAKAVLSDKKYSHKATEATPDWTRESEDINTSNETIKESHIVTFAEFKMNIIEHTSNAGTGVRATRGWHVLDKHTNRPIHDKPFAHEKDAYETNKNPGTVIHYGERSKGGGFNFLKEPKNESIDLDEWSADDMIAAATHGDKDGKTSKGTKYTGVEAEVDNKEKPKFEKPGSEAEKEKRGRGRPAGSKSGARSLGKDGGSSSGISSHRMSLPSKSVYY